VLRVLDAALEAAPQAALQAIRTRVVAAPEPPTFVPEGDFF
jgi:hypothetical protein